ncbi:hypothetical protein ABK040_010433 [Willaertia magna]
MSKRDRLDYEKEEDKDSKYSSLINSEEEQEDEDETLVSYKSNNNKGNVNNEQNNTELSVDYKRIKFQSPPTLPNSLQTLSINPSSLMNLDNDEAFDGIFYEGLPPRDSDFISCYNEESGDMCYITFRDDSELIYNSNNIGSKKQLIKTPINELIESVERERFQSEKSFVTKSITKQITSSTINAEIPNGRKVSELLVDKYSPKTFLDLLTDDKTNSEVLKWIKEWDPIVFPHKKPKLPAVSSTSSELDKNKEGNNKFKQNDNNKPQGKFYKKPTIGPEHRILLLAGPPGVGKSSLAHIVAKQAGYNPVEINASDERSKEKLLPKIQMFAQVNNVFGNGKPNLLILDEIDGVQNSESKSVISEILKLAYPKTAPDSKKEGEEKQTKTSKKSVKNGVVIEKKKKKKKDIGLTRPIICICNDHYAPGLRELRQKSKLFVFRRDDPLTDNTQRIVDRLQVILKKENLLAKTPKHELINFVKDADNDIRACLNTLQFMSIQDLSSGKLLTVTKDVKQDLFHTLHHVFKTKRADKTRIEKYKKNIFELYSTFSSELERVDTLLSGCFENYLNFCSDSSMTDIADMLSWTEWVDTLDKTIYRTQERSLNIYKPCALSQYFLKCRKSGFDVGQDFLQYPKKQSEARRLSGQRLNICKTLYNNCFTSASVGDNNLLSLPSVSDLKLDIAPYLPSLIVPKQLTNLSGGAALTSLAHNGLDGLRKLLKTDAERDSLNLILDICVGFGITLKQSFVHDKNQFVFDPPFDEFANYTSNNNNNQGNKLNNKSNKNEYLKDLTENTKRILSSAIHFANVEKRKAKKKVEGKENTVKTNPAESSKMNSAETAIELKKRRSSRGKSDITIYFAFHDGMNNSIRRPAKTNEFL